MDLSPSISKKPACLCSASPSAGSNRIGRDARLSIRDRQRQPSLSFSWDHRGGSKQTAIVPVNSFSADNVRPLLEQAVSFA